MPRNSAAVAGWLFAVASCVPAGNVAQVDAGPTAAASQMRPVPPPPPPADLLRAPFADDFDRTSPLLPTEAGTEAGAGAEAGTAVDPGPDWIVTQPGAWRIEGGHLCGERAHNHGVWLKRSLPTDARIEFDATSSSSDGDIKAEYWGDGRSFATSLSYTNATSYLTIFGGWHNKFHVLARINEHAADRKEIVVDAKSDDPRERAVVAGQRYHFKVERTEGRTVRWWVDGVEMLSYIDPAPLAGLGHDHFGFNDWEVHVCFDNVRVVPLP